jgi:glucosyl-3-phosphoglycerate synthase
MGTAMVVDQGCLEAIPRFLQVAERRPARLNGRVRRPTFRTFGHREFTAGPLAEAKAGQGHVVSVCLPARNEATTIGPIVEAIVTRLLDGCGLVDEVLVLDDHSEDRTAQVALDAGARVLAVDSVLPELGPGAGKGEALYKSVAAAEGDLIAWCDADIVDFDPHFVVGLLGPLLTRPAISFVKGFYDRPLDGATHGGGRVTELTARPAIATLFPHLASIMQPLSGEYAGRRSLFERLPFVQGYGVDLGLLIDITALEGAEAIAQVDLGVRRHRNRPLDELGPQALAVLLTALSRASEGRSRPATLVRPGLDPVPVGVDERPPLIDVSGYLRRSA